MSETGETKWAIVWRGAGPQGSDWWMLSPNGHRAPDFDEKSKRHLFDEPQSAGEWLDQARVGDPEHRSLLRVVRITSKPRLSPEAKAARDALCAAAMLFDRLIPEHEAAPFEPSLYKACHAYAKAVRK